MNKTEFKRIIFVGKAASGKDYGRKVLESIGLTYGISYTTRPPRKNEIDGVDYYFLTDEQFIEIIDNDEMYEFVVFNGWYYGTTKKQFYENCDVFIMTPQGLSHLSEEDRKESFVIYLDISNKERRKRLMERNDNDDSIQRRMEADHFDFSKYTDWDVKVEDSNYKLIEHVLYPAILVKQLKFNDHITNKIKAYEYSVI